MFHRKTFSKYHTEKPLLFRNISVASTRLKALNKSMKIVEQSITINNRRKDGTDTQTKRRCIVAFSSRPEYNSHKIQISSIIEFHIETAGCIAFLFSFHRCGLSTQPVQQRAPRPRAHISSHPPHSSISPIARNPAANIPAAAILSSNMVINQLELG